MTRTTAAVGGRGTGEEGVRWTTVSFAPSGAGFDLGREPTADAVGYRLSVLRTCRGSEDCARKRGMEPASVRQLLAAFAAFQTPTFREGERPNKPPSLQAAKGTGTKAMGSRLYIIHLPAHRPAVTKCTIYRRDPIVSPSPKPKGWLPNETETGASRDSERIMPPAQPPQRQRRCAPQPRVGRGTRPTLGQRPKRTQPQRGCGRPAPSRHPVIPSSRHPVILSSCHPVIPSSCPAPFVPFVKFVVFKMNLR